MGRRAGRHPSTVSYWLRKYGLRAVGAEVYGARGALDRDELESLLNDGLSIREVATAVDRSPATVRHWMRRYGLQSQHARADRKRSDAGDVTLRCRVHGLTAHRRRSDGGMRCLTCRSEAVARRRRQIKELLVAEAGGACVLCGYDRCNRALEFHHVDRASKAFGLAVQGLTRSLAAAREEARKCVLLCSNCHMEVEAGLNVLPLPADTMARSDPVPRSPVPG
jgi:Helix-turn-helix domain